MKKKKFDGRDLLYNHMMEIILLIITVFIALLAPGFFTLPNLLNILRNNSLKGVIAFGMTMVIICGEIDLSISSTVALSGVVTALVGGKLDAAGILPLSYGVWVGMLVSLIFATVIGLVNGYIRVQFNIPTFIITLAMMNLLYGVSAILGRGFPVTTLPSWFSVFGAGDIKGFPVPAVILILVFIGIYIVMEHTVFGREIYSTGGNPESARLSGINIRKVKIIVMIVVQVLSAVSGIMLSSQVMSGSHSFGKGWEMDVIASVIIGGASMNGGIGRVRGTFVGLIFLGVILNGMTLLNINEYVQYVVRGGLILMAVLVNTIQQNKKTTMILN